MGTPGCGASVEGRSRPCLVAAWPLGPLRAVLASASLRASPAHAAGVAVPRAGHEGPTGSSREAGKRGAASSRQRLLGVTPFSCALSSEVRTSEPWRRRHTALRAEAFPGGERRCHAAASSGPGVPAGWDLLPHLIPRDRLPQACLPPCLPSGRGLLSEPAARRTVVDPPLEVMTARARSLQGDLVVRARVRRPEHHRPRPHRE